MAENFGDIQKIKNKRNNFMGGVKEVSHVKRPTPAKAETVIAPAPITQAPQANAPEPTKQVVEDKDKTVLKKGFVVGYTEDGIVKLQPFGGIGELELISLIKYSDVKADDMLNKIARTSVSDIGPIKEGVTILAQSIRSLLSNDADVKAAS